MKVMDFFYLKNYSRPWSKFIYSDKQIYPLNDELVKPIGRFDCQNRNHIRLVPTVSSVIASLLDSLQNS